MTKIFYNMPLCDDEGRSVNGAEAAVFFSVFLDNGEPCLDIDRLELTDGGFVLHLSADMADMSLRTVFLRAAEALQQDEHFLSAAFESDGSVHFIGKGAHDPDGRYVIIE